MNYHVPRKALVRVIKEALKRKDISHKWKCAFCDWTQTCQLHHIKPRKNSGNNDPNNLIILCPNHHSLADLGEYDNNLLKNWTIGKLLTAEFIYDIFMEGNW